MNRQEAIKRKENRYNGKICNKHPELEGERYLSSSVCVACSYEKYKVWSKKLREETIQLDVKIKTA